MQVRKFGRARVAVLATVLGLTAAALFAVVALAASDKPAKSGIANTSAACLTTMRCSANKADASWPLGQDGSLGGGRFSPLTQINQSNVRKLKVAWTFQTNILGAENYPTVVGNDAYVTTSYGNVYKLNASTGEKIWTWNAFKQKALGLSVFAGVHGFPNRGITLAEGKVFAVTPNAAVVALNQANGRVLWSHVQADPHYYSLSSPPAYWKGVLYYGSGGSDAGARGFVEARSARTGNLLWRWYAAPAYGHGYLYQHHGGGAVWMAPVLNPKMNMLLAGTGNPAPDEYGVDRPGPNLWTDSVVALNMKTGKMIWGAQQTPHDLWDYDSVSPPLIFPTRAGMAVGEANKGGFWYAYDLKTGTQLNSPVAFVKQDRKLAIPGGPAVWNWPGGLHGGGSEWSPHVYDPQTKMIYVDGLNSPDLIKVPKQQPKFTIGADIGSDLTLLAKTKDVSGTITAIDASEGAIVWQNKYPVAMVGGNTGTAGHLLFGEISGKGTAIALDPRTGRQLWSASLGGRIDDAPSVYSVNGKEYVLYAVGGSSIAAGGWGGKSASNAKYVAFAVK